MPRTIKPQPGKKKDKDYNGPFPIQDDAKFLALTPNRQKFVYNLFLKPVSGWSNGKCYQDAYGRDTITGCYESACELIKQPVIKYCVDACKRAHTAQLGYSAERVLLEVGALGFSDVAEYFDSDGYLVMNPKDLPEEARRAISGITKSYDQEGNPRWKVSLWSKPEALKMLVNIHDMGSAKKVEMSGPGGGPIQHQITTQLRMDLLTDTELVTLSSIVEKLADKGE